MKKIDLSIPNYFGHESIFFKYWKRIFITTLIPVLILTFLSYAILVINARNSSKNAIQSEFDNTYISFNNIADEFFSKYLLISNNSNVGSFWLTSKQSLHSSSVQANNSRVNDLISSLRLSSSLIDEINIYSQKCNYILSSGNANTAEWFYDTSWIDAYNAKNNNYFIFSNKNRYIFFVYASPQADGSLGIVSFKTDLNDICDKINMFSMPTTINFYDTASGKYIVDNDLKTPIQDIQNHGQNFYCVKQTSMPNIMLVTETKIVHYKYNKILTAGISLCVLLTIIFSILISRYVSSDFYKSIADIVLQIKENDLETENGEQNYNSELEYIQKNIVALHLSKQLTADELSQKISMLKFYQTLMLQNQFNPHFLFNSLNAVSSILINSCDDSRPCEIINGICELMTVAYNSKKYVILLEQEIEYIKTYLHIEEIKSNYSFDTEYDIDSSISQCQILKFILQPLVENSVFYGIKRISQYERGLISISAHKNGENISISVKDNGPGMTTEKVAEIYKNMNSEDILKAQHIGLCNVHNRLKLFYGDDYGISHIKSDSDGTCIEILLPIKN